MTQKRKSYGGGEPAQKRHQSNGQDQNRRQKTTNGNNNNHHQTLPQLRQHTNTPLPALPPIAPEYSTAVFTHMSGVSTADTSTGYHSYERLEFLGDAYIELAASRLIWSRFPTLPAGKMSQLRESLVRNETLAELAVAYGFDVRFRGAADLKGNPGKWTKIRGDMFEAYVAAVALSDAERGPEVVERWLVELWTPRLGLGLPVEKRVPDMLSKQNLSGKIGGKGVVISYVEERATVYEKGDQVYSQGVYLTGWGWENQHLGSGKGTNKSAAGNDAAAKALANTLLIDEIVEVKRKALAEREREREKEAAKQAKDEHVAEEAGTMEESISN